MGGLLGSLRIGLSSLNSTGSAIAVGSDNIANVNTPGYARKRVIFERQATTGDFREQALGVTVGRVESVRNSFLDKRILSALQEQGKLSGQSFGLSQIEGALYSTTTGLGDEISRFFSAFSEVAADASSLELRQNAISQAVKTAALFNRTSDQLSSVQVEGRAQARDAVSQINLILDRLSSVSTELAPHVAAGEDGGSLLDQQQQLLGELAQLVDITTYQSETGILTVTTVSGQLLLTGNESFPLELDETAEQFIVRQAGQDITSRIQGGSLGGFIELDRNLAPSYRNALDTLAEQFAEQVNTLHSTGQDLNGNPGANVFNYAGGDAAASLTVNLTDPATLAAGSGGGPGDGRLAEQIANLRNQPVAGLGGKTVSGFYADMVFQSGLDSRLVQEGLRSQNEIVSQIQDQRDSFSGVSLDEEMVNLLQLQKTYQASSRFIRLIDELLQETVNLIR